MKKLPHRVVLNGAYVAFVGKAALVGQYQPDKNTTKTHWPKNCLLIPNEATLARRRVNSLQITRQWLTWLKHLPLELSQISELDHQEILRPQKLLDGVVISVWLMFCHLLGHEAREGFQLTLQHATGALSFIGRHTESTSHLGHPRNS